MSKSIIIDRRKDPGHKSSENREKFLKRVKGQIKKEVEKLVNNDKYNVAGGSGDVEINVSVDGIKEPTFTHNKDSGEYDFILPGNKEYVEGDFIEKPQKKPGKGGAQGEDGEDNFSFVLSEREFLDILFSELELPDLVKKSSATIEHFSKARAGTTSSGSPNNLNLVKTAISGLSRRVALLNPKLAEIEELEEELKLLSRPQDEARILEIERLIEELKNSASHISYLEDVDIRYNNYINVPKPITKAVMFLILDVSGSMGEREKLIAKKFFILLNLFLKVEYKHIDIVFIRHTTEARECDEQEFFYSRETGGTLVSSSYELILEILKTRYKESDYNIYVAQASDGDNHDPDNKTCVALLEKLFPKIQFMVYLEILRNDPMNLGAIFVAHEDKDSTLWQCLFPLENKYPLACSRVSREEEVMSVFVKLFAKRKTHV